LPAGQRALDQADRMQILDEIPQQAMPARIEHRVVIVDRHVGELARGG